MASEADDGGGKSSLKAQSGQAQSSWFYYEDDSGGSQHEGQVSKQAGPERLVRYPITKGLDAGYRV